MDFSYKVKQVILLVLAGVYVLVIFLFWQIPDKKLHLYFLDIGQGDSIFIKTPENNQILVDGGPQNKVVQELGEVMPFFDKSIDLVILTHPHADHVDGLVEVLKRYKVGAVIFTGVDFKNPSYDEFLREIDRQNIPFLIAESETDLRLGEILLDVIYPFKELIGEKFKNPNNSSVAVKLMYGNLAVLLTGDLEKEAEEELIKSGVDLKADIFKAGHHGSKTSSTKAFLSRVKPEIVVIQSGQGNKFGHPNKETLENLEAMGVEKIYRNDLEGRIEFVF